jgi:diguanylate cyclase (GGDEF)-like protein/PAS domain S-box-containing protein
MAFRRSVGQDSVIAEHAIKWTRRVRLPTGDLYRAYRSSGPLALGLVGVAYFAVAKLGLSFASGSDIVSAVWPPSGLALAAAVVYGARVGPPIFVAALLSNATGDSSLATAAGIAIGNAVAAVTGGALLARFDFDPALGRVRDVVVLAVAGAAASTAINATIGTASLLAAGVAEWDSLWSFWRVWWLGDLTGVLLVAPPLLLLAAGGQRAPHRAWIAEASLQAGALVAAMLLVLREGVTLAYPIFPLIVLAAMRFRQAGAVVAALVVSTIAVIYTANGKGPFAGGAEDMDLLRAQVFVGLAALTGLLVAAMRTEWERAEGALEQLAASEHAHRLAEERFRVLLESAPDAMVIADERGDIVLVNTQAERLFRYPREKLIGRPMALLVPDWVPGTADDEPQPAAGLDLVAWRSDGVEFPVEVTRAPLQMDDGILVSSAIRDTTERRQAARRLEHQALHDPLTDLPNRALFLDRLEHALARSRRPGTSLAAYFCDVDDFKNVNDSLGHETGDELLVALPPRLRQALRAGDTIARFGGDEFVILCEDLASEAEAVRIAERIAEAFALPFELDGRPHHLSVSVGVVYVTGGRASASEVLRDADAAMYRAKAGGKGRFELFDARMRAALVTRLQTEADLRGALASDELRLLYQPLLSLERDTFVGAEALVRWQHPTRGLLAPADFIAVAEDSGLIAPLGAWVLGEACRQAAAWARAAQEAAAPYGPAFAAAPRTVSVNLSPRQLSHSDVPALLEKALADSGADPALIELEITESVLMEQSAAALATLRRLKELGVRLVLDDFGTGWSSLGYLKRFPIDALKIDREFVDGLGSEAEDTAIVTAVLSMAEALDLDVIAEGVETEAQLAWLREHGCGFAQGFLLGRPAAADELDRLAGWR